MKPTIVLMVRPYAPESIRETGGLDLRNIKESEWRTIVSSCKSASLRLYHIMVESLEGIERLDTTSSLSIEWANKVSELSPVFKMVWLKNLFVSDFPVLASIDGIEALEHLTTLHVSGNLGSLHPPLRLVSLQPIAKLSNLAERPSRMRAYRMTTSLF